MKTKHLHAILTLFLFVFITNTSVAQSLFDNGYATDLDPLTNIEPIDLRTYELDIDSFALDYDISEAPESITAHEDAAQVAATFVRAFLAFGAGLGFGNDDTLYCFHAAYYLKLAMVASSALYGSLGVVYSGLSGNNITESLIDLQLKFLMFTAITRYKQVHFLYGLMVAYGFGTLKFDSSYSYDITKLTAALVLGLSIILTTQWAIMLQTNVLAYISQKQKFEGNETKDSNTYGFINKNNILAFSLVYMFANSR